MQNLTYISSFLLFLFWDLCWRVSSVYNNQSIFVWFLLTPKKFDKLVQRDWLRCRCKWLFQQTSYGRYTYDVHENWKIFKTTQPLVQLRPKFFHPLDLERPISNDPPLPPPSTNHLQIITNQLKENIIQGWTLHVIRSFPQVSFCSQYQLINFVWLSIDFYLFSWSQLCPRAILKT